MERRELIVKGHLEITSSKLVSINSGPKTTSEFIAEHKSSFLGLTIKLFLRESSNIF